MIVRPGPDRARHADAPAHHLARLATRRAPVADPGEACQQARAAGLVVHRADPLNAETPLGMLPGRAVVPSDRFYVRNHFGIPALDAATSRLEVGGMAGQPLSYTLADLRSMPSQSVVVTLECAGNGRSGVDPPAPGEQWGLGAVGAAAWTGVPLTEVLARAAPQAGAREVVFRGADRGPVEGHAGPVHFERSLPISGLGSAGALLAYAMNGQPLPAAHGYPLRLIVPGWYGVASVKWLTSIELTDRAFHGHFQADRYHIGGEPLTLQAVRSLITELRPGDPAAPGEVVVCGLAWSGAAPITRVEVSLGGQPWQRATLTDPGHPYGWYSWQLLARLEVPGSISVRARATDAAGRTQPSRPAWNPLGYANNAVHRVRIGPSGCTAQRQTQRNDPPKGASMNRPEAARQAQQARAHRVLPTRNPPRRGARRLPGRSPSPHHQPRSAARGTTLTLRDGSLVLIRQVQTADVPLVADIFDRLSPTSRWMRFLAAKSHLTEAELRYLTDIDHHNHEALAALDHPGGDGLGVARYIRHPHDPQAAEIAIAVVDDWHRRGLGTELMSQLSDRARRAGIGRLTALMSADNVAMARLLHTMGAKLIGREADTAEYQIILAPNAEHNHDWRA